MAFNGRTNDFSYIDGPAVVAYNGLPLAAFLPQNSFAAAQAVAAQYVYTAIDRHVSRERLTVLARQGLALLKGQDPKGVVVQGRLEKALGIDLPLDPAGASELLAEVHRFKWLEAERAGRDIWRERHPSDPEAGAAREWFRLYFGAWYLARTNRKLSRA